MSLLRGVSSRSLKAHANHIGLRVAAAPKRTQAVQFCGHRREIADKLWGVESAEQPKQRALKEKQALARLGLAKTYLEDAEREHIWAIASAHSEGLSIRKIAGAMG